MIDSRVLYKVNEGFRQYVTKYCRKHECTVEESFTHSIVQSAAEYYESAELGEISVSEVKAGCSGAVSGGDCK